MSPVRLLSSALALAAVALLATGCAMTPASPAPTSTGGADADTSAIERTVDDIDAAWLDGGRMIAVVTWGSSSPDCRPAQAEARADGQTVHVVLTDPAEAAAGCDADLIPRATLIGVPEGVDVTKGITVDAEYGDVSGAVVLAALEVDAGSAEDAFGLPSAGWFAQDGLVLLTYGSSSCPPITQDLEMTDTGATVTFQTTDRVCTMDLAPRATAITLPEARDDDAPFTLTLVGDNLDGEVPVLG